VKFETVGTQKAGVPTLFRAAQRWLQGVEPPQLHAGAGVENKLAHTRDVSEETGVQSGGAGDGEVGASAEAAVVRQIGRDERQLELLSCTPASITTRLLQ
jgi:hypothetical protein